jgi:hypothetical protein
MTRRSSASVARLSRMKKQLRAQLPRGSLPLPFFCQIMYNISIKELIP